MDGVAAQTHCDPIVLLSASIIRVTRRHGRQSLSYR